MITVNNLSYEFPQKELYNRVSFTLEDNQHCAFIGSNGTGKSTLIDMIMEPDKYIYDGKIEKSSNCRIGYVSQFYNLDKAQDKTVFEYISEEFVEVQGEINDICTQMETASDLEKLLDQYQDVLDRFNAIDGDNYESNIKKKLKVANLTKHENQLLSKLSGGEFKLIQVIKEMITMPNLMIMDEPDVFLDFVHVEALKNLINTHKGTILVITHNRYLLNNCFNKIIHLENAEIQEFDGSYIEYNFTLLQTKIEMQELAAADVEEIERNKAVVDKLRKEATMFDSSSRGRALHARVSLLERLEARKIKSPFIDIKQLEIMFNCDNNNYTGETDSISTEQLDDNIDLNNAAGLNGSTKLSNSEKIVVAVDNYSISFENELLKDISFNIKSNEKVAIVGENGTGKTTLLREIYKNNHKAINIDKDINVAFLSQLQGEMLNEEHTVFEEFEELGFNTKDEIKDYLLKYGFEEAVNHKVKTFSGGEKNLLQLAKISVSNANLLLLDEPTSHLDTYAQLALEKAVSEYKGAVIMVSHDFYTIVNCADYVLLIEDSTIRKVSMRKFRKMIYTNHFDKDYLEIEQKKKELETRIAFALNDNNFERAKTLAEELEKVISEFHK